MALSAKELAREFGTDARNVRKFLREASDLEAPGQGARWSFEKKQVKSLKKKFDAWNEKKNTRSKASEEVDTDEDVEELTDEDLEDIEEELDEDGDVDEDIDEDEEFEEI